MLCLVTPLSICPAWRPTVFKLWPKQTRLLIHFIIHHSQQNDRVLIPFHADKHQFYISRLWPQLVYIHHVITNIFLSWHLFWNHLFFYLANILDMQSSLVLFKNHVFLFPFIFKKIKNANKSSSLYRRKTLNLQWTGISNNFCGKSRVPALLCWTLCCSAALLWPQRATVSVQNRLWQLWCLPALVSPNCECLYDF